MTELELTKKQQNKAKGCFAWINEDGSNDLPHLYASCVQDLIRPQNLKKNIDVLGSQITVTGIFQALRKKAMKKAQPT